MEQREFIVRIVCYLKRQEIQILASGTMSADVQTWLVNRFLGRRGKEVCDCFGKKYGQSKWMLKKVI